MKYIAIGGGGFKAYSYIGALKKVKLENVKAVSGSSAGSLIGFFVCLTKSSSKIEEIAMDEKYRIFDQNDIDIHNFLPYYGFNTGDSIERKLELLSEEHCGIKRPTFSEFSLCTKTDFYVTATNLTKGECETFSPSTTPNFDVIKAVRMSISIPLYFTPVIIDGQSYVDGSFFNPIPYDCLLDNYDDISPENGLMIGSKEGRAMEYNGLFEYFMCLFHLIRKGLITNKKDVDRFTSVKIDTHEFPFVDHKCDNRTLSDMIQHGYDSFV